MCETPRKLKSLGQHFLLQPKINERIAQEAVAQTKNAAIIEIGAGSGALTKSLLKQKFKQLIVIEYDKRMRAILEPLTCPDNVSLMLLDVMSRQMHHLTAHRPLIVTGNLPYHIAVPLMMKMIVHPQEYERLVFVVQKEIAQRLDASCGSKHYGRVSILTQRLWHVRVVRFLPPHVFTPKPKVHSALISLEPRDTPLASCDPRVLDAILRLAFAQRRKMIKNSLKKMGDTLLDEAGIDGNLRPEQLDIDSFCRMARCASHFFELGDEII